MSKTIFISQPMGGLSDEQVLQERTAAISKAKALLGEDVAPLETFFDDFGPAAKPLDYLAAIEAFEDNPPVADAGVSDQTRIADALEDMVALSLPDAE